MFSVSGSWGFLFVLGLGQGLVPFWCGFGVRSGLVLGVVRVGSCLVFVLCLEFLFLVLLMKFLEVHETVDF